MTTSARVGLTVVVALALLLGAYVMLQGTFLLRRTYPIVVQFENAQGVTKGTEARVSGVRVGEVVEVRLAENRRADVRILVDQRYRISADDRIAIATGGLLPTPYIEIVPAQTVAVTPTGVFVGRSAVTTDEVLTRFNDLLPEARKLVTSLASLSRSLELIVGDPGVAGNWKNTAANLASASARGKDLMAHLDAASARGERMVENLELTTRAGRPRLERSLANVEAASKNFEQTMAQLRSAAAENRPKVGETLENLSGAMAALQEVMSEVKTTLADQETRKNLKETLAQMQQAMANLREAAANLAGATGDVRQLTSDPKVGDDLRQTVAATRSTMEQANVLVQRLNGLVGGAREKAAGVRQQVQRIDVRGDLVRKTRPGRTRLDLDATMPVRDGFFRFGVYDFSEGNRINLQRGQSMSDRATLRYGFHASRLGLGLDFGSPQRPWLETDLYSLRDPRLDLRASHRLNTNLDLTLGVDDLLGRNAPVVGLRMKF